MFLLFNLNNLNSFTGHQPGNTESSSLFLTNDIEQLGEVQQLPAESFLSSARSFLGLISHAWVEAPPEEKAIFVFAAASVF